MLRSKSLNLRVIRQRRDNTRDPGVRPQASLVHQEKNTLNEFDNNQLILRGRRMLLRF